MKKIENNVTSTIVINKSEFITNLYKVKSIDEVNQILQDVRKKYYDATHNCYAYIIGENQEIQKASDDGEPQKTAGFPMLDVLKKNELTDILAVVTRYFGGTLLGAGGLIRAYSSSVSEALKKTKLLSVLCLTSLKLVMDYKVYNSVLKILEENYIENSLFNDSVIVYLNVLPEKLQSLTDLLNEKSGGNIRIEIIGSNKTLV